MTSPELYYEFHLLLNKNASAKNISVPKPNYVFLFNREARKWLNSFIKKHKSTVQITEIQELLNTDVSLTIDQRFKQYDAFNLPEDYFEFNDSSAVAEKGKCTKDIIAYLSKPYDVKQKFNVSDFEPSFEFEETICNISSKKLLIYKKDFEIKDAFLSYYKVPDPINLEGYIQPNGLPSDNKDSTLNDSLLSQINEELVLETMRQFENTQGFQLSKERVTN